MKLLKVREVEAMTGLQRVTIWRLEQKGLFPRRRQATPKSVRWIEQEIETWIESLPVPVLREESAMP
jgi:predicted DNA-binding transcriptional regulator AlpA